MQYKNKTIQIEVEDGYEYTLRRVQVNVLELSDGSIQIMYKEQKLSYSIMNLAKSTRVYDSKQVNKRVDKIKLNQGHSYQFNLLGRTFLLWRKPDISTWG